MSTIQTLSFTQMTRVSWMLPRHLISACFQLSRISVSRSLMSVRHSSCPVRLPKILLITLRHLSRFLHLLPLVFSWRRTTPSNRQAASSSSSCHLHRMSSSMSLRRDLTSSLLSPVSSMRARLLLTSSRMYLKDMTL